jgi:hypothetical protein
MERACWRGQEEKQIDRQKKKESKNWKPIGYLAILLSSLPYLLCHYPSDDLLDSIHAYHHEMKLITG